jgi:gentisate 1,2-dioxygenase
VQIDGATETLPFRTTGNAVCAVVEGRGTSQVGDVTLRWGPKDVFSLPHGNWITHRADGTLARLFVVTDRDVLRRLDLLKEEFGNERR